MNLEQFRSIILPICQNAKRRRCHDYSTALQNVRTNLPEDTNDLPLIKLFEGIFSYYLKPDSPSEAFGPMFIMGGRRSPIPADLTKEQRDYLSDILPHVEDHEMRARFADTLWDLKHGKAIDYAIVAIKAYLAAAAESDEDGWKYDFDHYSRAMRIYASIRRADKDGQIGVNVIGELVRAAQDSVTSGSPILAKRLVGLLLDFRAPESLAFIPDITSIAEKLEETRDYHSAHDAWLLLARLLNFSKKPQEEAAARTRAAETFVKLADLAEKSPNPSYMQICMWLERAVTSHKKIAGGKARADELYLRLTASQPRIKDEMQHHTFKIDIRDSVEQAIEHVSNRSAIGALMSLAFYRRPSSRAELQKYAAEKAEAGPLADMIAATYHNKAGHVVARKGLDESEESKLFRAASEIRDLQPALFIEPALAQVRFEHAISLQQWIDFLHSHPFIPETHRMTFARGLYYGFQGDYIAAAHILMPQVEASLRHILKEAGQETSKFNTEGLQEEKTLSQLLEIEQLSTILGANIVFDIRGLLDEKDGDNFRHLLLHGLQDDNDLEGSLPIYFYWLMLHLIFMPLNTDGLDLGKKKEVPADTE